jgi:hypothetical protein
MDQLDLVAEHLLHDGKRDENVVGIVLDQENPDRRTQLNFFFLLIVF